MIEGGNQMVHGSRAGTIERPIELGSQCRGPGQELPESPFGEERLPESAPFRVKNPFDDVLDLSCELRAFLCHHPSLLQGTLFQVQQVPPSSLSPQLSALRRGTTVPVGGRACGAHLPQQVADSSDRRVEQFQGPHLPAAVQHVGDDMFQWCEPVAGRGEFTVVALHGEIRRYGHRDHPRPGQFPAERGDLSLKSGNRTGSFSRRQQVEFGEDDEQWSGGQTGGRGEELDGLG